MNENSSGKQWEELRRLARQYENDIDAKLFSLSKLMSAHNEKKYSTRYDDAEPLISSKENFKHLSFELESLITSLQDINNQMNQCTQQLPNSNAMLYTLQRHLEILNDYRKEFLKLRTNIEEQLNRDLLFDNMKKDDYKDFSMPSNLRKNDYLMKENDHIRNSEIMIDDQINIAIRTRDTLRNQRSLMKAIQTRLTTLTHNFPLINNVMSRIEFKKHKDSLILAIVIGICLFIFLFWNF